MSEVKLVYFAWVRERTGCAEETLTLPSTIRTIADLARADRIEANHVAEALQFRVG